MQLTPVMQQLAQVKSADFVDAGAPAKATKALKGGVVEEVELPGEPPPIFDSALDLPGFKHSKEMTEKIPLDTFPTAIQALPEKTIYPVPQIADLPLADVSSEEIKAFLLWFKERSDVSKIADPARDHATHGPSSGERDVMCVAANPLTYIIRRDKPGEERKSYADEGHYAHEVASAFVKARLENAPYPYTQFSAKPYKPDMIKYAQEYAEYVYNACSPYLHLPHSWLIEERICIDYVRDAWGTLDFAFVARDGDKLYAVIVDYKYGMGVDVDTENAKTGYKNWQLALYALGVIGKFLNFSVTGEVIVVHAVTAHIFQPRIDTTDAPITFSLNELLEKYLVKYLEAIDQSKEIVTQVRTYEQIAEVWEPKWVTDLQQVGKWCQFCKAKPICNAYQNFRGVPQASDVFKKALTAGLIDKKEKEPVKQMWKQGVISAEDLAFIALHGSKMKSLIDECADVAVELIQQGEQLPDCAIEKVEGRRGWIEDKDQVIKTLTALGVEQPFENVQKIITITEAEKEIGFGKIEELTEKGNSSLKLVHVSKVKNPAAVGAGAALLFKKHMENK